NFSADGHFFGSLFQQFSLYEFELIQGIISDFSVNSDIIGLDSFNSVHHF
ncbi:34895_t:CDS:1, partial [Gigaspora margarita]